MKSVAHEVALLLSDGTLGGTSPWSIYLAVEPNSPVNVVTLYDTGGDRPDTDELDIFHPSFQVRVRGLSYPDAYAKQVEIRDELIHSAAFESTDGDSRYESIMATSDILSIGRDENDRHLLTANYQVIREEL